MSRVISILFVRNSAAATERSCARSAAAWSKLFCGSPGQPDPAQLIVTYRNEEAHRLNEAVRAGRQAAGELAPRGVQVGRLEYSAGDRLVFLKNDHQGRAVETHDRAPAGVGVKNGTLGTIETAGEQRFVVRLDEGRRVAFNPPTGVRVDRPWLRGDDPQGSGRDGRAGLCARRSDDEP
jgi:hypothetical protein